MSYQIPAVSLLSLSLTGCFLEGDKESETETEEVEEEEQEDLTSLEGIVGDWFVSSLDGESQPVVAEEGYSGDNGSIYVVHYGYGFGMTIDVEGITELFAGESETVIVDGVINEEESETYFYVLATGTSTRDDANYSIDLTDEEGENILFSCTMPDDATLDCTFEDENESVAIEFSKGSLAELIVYPSE